MGKEVGLERQGASEAEKCDADAELTCLEELESEVPCFSSRFCDSVLRVLTHSKTSE